MVPNTIMIGTRLGSVATGMNIYLPIAASHYTTSIIQKPFDEIIKQDHGLILDSYERFKTALPNVKVAIANSIIRDIAVHSVAEECTIYPRFKKYLNNGDELSKKARQEHQLMKKNLFELDNMKFQDPRFENLLEQILKNFAEHAENEEMYYLPSMRALMNASEARKIGKAFELVKKAAPTHPHPSSTDKGGILELMEGFIAKPYDAMRDITRDFAEDFAEESIPK